MKNEKKRALFDAVTGIDEDLIDEAAAPKALPFPKRILRVATIAAVIAILMTALLWPSEENYITGPGLLVVHAYATDERTDEAVEWVVLEEGVVFTPNVQYIEGASRIQRFPFTFYIDNSLYPDMAISIEVNTDAGIFACDRKTNNKLDISQYAPAILQLVSLYSGQRFTTDINTRLFWEPLGFDYNYATQEIAKGNFDFHSVHKPCNFETGPAYIDVIIRADDYIVGYGVIEIRENGTNIHDAIRKFSFELLTMVSFPPVDGQFQNISERYIATQIQQIHKNT